MVRRAAAVVIVLAGCSAGESTPASTDAGGGDAGRAPPRTGPAEEDAGFDGPTRLSETGLYADFAARTLAPGIRRFAPVHPLWSDGESKQRYILVPAGKKIDTSDVDRWVFPVGTKLFKEFRVDGNLIETRMLEKREEGHGFGKWLAIAYVWEPDGSDAIAKPEGVVRASGTNHDVPSQADCKACHGNVKDTPIGFSAFELSKPPADAPPAEDTGLLLTFAGEGLFTAPPAADLVVPGDAPVRDALGYLHGNCGFCHNEDGALRFQSAMRLRLHASETTPEATTIYTTTIHTKMRHVAGDGVDEAVVPGDPARSQLYLRLTATDISKMPPKGPKTVDPTGSALVEAWIKGLPGP